MHHGTQGLFEFEEFRLEVAERRLLRHGELIPLPPKVFDLLCLLVQNHGRLLEKEVLLKSLWPDSFVEESNLSVNVSSLRRALGDGSKYIETVPKRGYRFVGIVQEKQPSVGVILPESAIAPALRRARLPFSRIAIGVGLILLLGSGFAVWNVLFAPPDHLHSIAVLPLIPISQDDSDQYLALGMADAIATRLAEVQKLEVKPMSSVLKFAGVQRDPLAAGRELRVDAVLDGHIQYVDNDIRVTLQVWRVRDGKQLLAQTFDDRFTNVFALQDSISEQVCAALSMKLSESDQRALSKHTTANPEAYRLYLQGQYLASKRLNAATQQAIESFQKAISVDPQYSPPYAALANSYLLRSGEGLNQELRERAKTAALKALNLDENLPEAHLALGEVFLRADWDWAGAERSFRRAVALNPRLASSHSALATIQTFFGRHDDAIREMEEAVRLEPDSATVRSDLAWTLQFARRFSEAAAAAAKAVELDPWSYTAHRQLGKAYIFQSKPGEALIESRKSLEINGGRRRRVLAEIATAEVAAGQSEQANNDLRDLTRDGWEEPEPSYEMAVLYSALGDSDSAFRSLEKACDRRLSRAIWLNSDPELDPIRSDPRFRQLVANRGLGR